MEIDKVSKKERMQLENVLAVYIAKNILSDVVLYKYIDGSKVFIIEDRDVLDMLLDSSVLNKLGIFLVEDTGVILETDYGFIELSGISFKVKDTIYRVANSLFRYKELDLLTEEKTLLKRGEVRKLGDY